MRSARGGKAVSSAFMAANSTGEGVRAAAVKPSSMETVLLQARKTGTLNLSNKKLKQLPDEVCHISELTFGDKWWELGELTKLDLSHNELTELPEDIGNLKDLVSVMQSNNQLTALPVSLFLLANLKKLDTSHNLLQSLPPSFSSCTSLVELNLQGNALREIPFDVGQLRALESLNLRQNQLQGLPDSLCLCEHLRRLSLASNQLTSLPQHIGNLSRLEELDIGQNKLQLLPDSVELLQNLVQLDARENQFRIFYIIPASKVLDSLILSFNGLIAVDNLHHAPNLSVLDLKNNKIENFPQSILDLKALKTLDLSNNDLSDLPAELGLVKSLVRLTLDGNPMRSIRRPVVAGGTETIKKYLRTRLPEAVEDTQSGSSSMSTASSQLSYGHLETFVREAATTGELHLNGQSLTDLPVWLSDLRDLSLLDVSNNSIVALSSHVSSLQKLKTLAAHHNEISLVPLDILSLELLTSLDLSANKLQRFLPDADLVNRLNQLQILKLSSNQLRSFPAEVTNIKSLVELHLDFTGLTTVEELVSNGPMPKLSVLNLNNNRLTTIPAAVPSIMPSLTFLGISNNDIANLPTELGFMANLRGLMLEGNPLKSIRRPILERGSIAVLAYLRDRHTPDPNAAAVGPAAGNPSEAAKSKAEIAREEKEAIDRLEASIEKLTEQLDDMSLSQAKKFALKKQLQMEKAEKVRRERQLHSLLGYIH
eukprot:GILJ01012129.1.p1 GENE.GILJ01012129.1~~GILJ01012129.1.p1  ORF type:complete len:710 (+),score=124.52 GILJ01012129.1:74-2203(+)